MKMVSSIFFIYFIIAINFSKATDNKIVLLNGYGLGLCTSSKTKCPNDTSKRSFWAFYPSKTECERVAKDLLNYGLNKGDPQCFLCPKIVLDGFGMLSCRK